MHEDLAIVRSIDLDIGADEAADLATTADGWRVWLADEVDLSVDERGGEGGTVVDDGVERAVRVDERTDRSVRFRWWETGEPGTASEVVIRVHPTDTGSRIEIGERRLAASASAPASAGAAEGLVRWQVRACLIAMRAISLAVA